MLAALRRLWSTGVAGNPVSLRRQIELCNQVGLFGAAATVPYQFFYFFYDFALYRGVFLANLIFIAAYLLVLLINRRGWYNTARNLLLVNASCQLFVVTFFISAGAGVHLFYFTLAAILVFLFQYLHVLLYIAIMTAFGSLYVAAHFLFPQGSVAAPVPSPWIDIMYAGSVAGVLTLSGVFLYLFRKNIDQAESELTINNRYLETLSSTDPLTGLANRRGLDETLEREWARLSRHPAPLSVIMCDVDHFKLFNDRYGHDGGDRCLQQIATTLKDIVSRPSDLVARYGGEEFALVLPGTGEEGARYLGEKLREAVRELAVPNADVGTGARITISVGVTSIDHFRSDEAACLLKRADTALYQAKENGRNQVVFLPYNSPRSSGNGGS
ncbi:GGDEF domain-containing protein [Marinobacter sp. SS13-12]|uniref:GGDEF domain-containing protein n=1 Tax=Marinobacter sp. SS13-12 TaxID=3050451 RepID=UPI002552CA36|nr:GGDEF domain-containing protein [Marinobacter sp. SS13-12]MDK8464048.1 GGDEF domain-containing protein [Marinobacter sp. SS13-12]